MFKKFAAMLLVLSIVFSLAVPVSAMDLSGSNVIVAKFRSPDGQPHVNMKITVAGKTYTTDQNGMIRTEKLAYNKTENGGWSSRNYPYTYVAENVDGSNWVYQQEGGGSMAQALSSEPFSDTLVASNEKVISKQFELIIRVVTTSGDPLQKADVVVQKQVGNEWKDLFQGAIHTCTAGQVSIKTVEQSDLGFSPAFSVNDHFRLVAKDTTGQVGGITQYREFDIKGPITNMKMVMVAPGEEASNVIPELKATHRTSAGLNLQFSYALSSLSSTLAKDCFTVHTTQGDIKPDKIGVVENSVDLSFNTSATITGVSYTHNPQTGLVNEQNNKMAVANFNNTAVPYQDTSDNNSAFEDRVVELVNIERANNVDEDGNPAPLPPLVNDPTLKSLAEFKANDFVYAAYWEHYSPAYGYHYNMMKQFGVSTWANAENIAERVATPEGVVNGWMHSEGHRVNILNPDMVRLGVGYNKQKNQWVQIFGSMRYKLNLNKTGEGSVSGAAYLDENRATTVSASPVIGYEFLNWTENGEVVSTNKEYTFTRRVADGDCTLTANFRKLKYNISLSASDGLGGTGGTVSGSGSFDYQTNATVTATPAEGYLFVNWTNGGKVVSTNASYSFTLQNHMALTANFEPQTVHVTVNTPDSVMGSVSKTGTFDYSHGTRFSLTATPTRAYKFVGWYQNGALLSSNATATFTANNHMTLTAQFEPRTIRHIALQFDSAYGTVERTKPAGQVGDLYYDGEAVTLKATPTATGKFLGWSRSDGVTIADPTAATYSFTASGDVTVTANFVEQDKHEVTLDNTNPNVGEVTGLKDSYYKGESMTLKASVKPEHQSTYYFAGWYKGDTRLSADATYTATVSESFTIIAKFEEKTHYTLTAVAEEGGFVSAVRPFYYDGESARLTASAYFGYQFMGWYEGATLLSTKLSETFVMNGNRTITAKFASAPDAALTITSSNAASTVETGAGTYKQGQMVTVTAGLKVQGALQFKEWQINGVSVSKEPTYTFQITGNTALKAVYSDVTYLIKSLPAMMQAGVQSLKFNGVEYKSGLTIKAGTQISLDVTMLDGYEFVHWYYLSNGSSIILTGKGPQCTITADSDMTIYVKADYKKTESKKVTFQKSSGSVLFEATVEKGAAAPDPVALGHITAPASLGFEFVGWDKPLTNITEDTVFTAQFKYKPQACVITLDKGFAVNQINTTLCSTVTLNAARSSLARDSSKIFAYWQRSDGVIVSYDPVYTFQAMNDIELHAVYTDRPIEKKPVVTIGSDTVVNTATGKITFSAQVTVPNGYEIVEYGMVLSNTLTGSALNLNAAGVLRGKAASMSNKGQFTITKTKVTSGKAFNARTYLIYKDASGTLYTIYSDTTATGRMP